MVFSLSTQIFMSIKPWKKQKYHMRYYMKNSSEKRHTADFLFDFLCIFPGKYESFQYLSSYRNVLFGSHNKFQNI